MKYNLNGKEYDKEELVEMAKKGEINLENIEQAFKQPAEVTDEDVPQLLGDTYNLEEDEVLVSFKVSCRKGKVGSFISEIEKHDRVKLKTLNVIDQE